MWKLILIWCSSIVVLVLTTIISEKTAQAEDPERVSYADWGLGLLGCAPISLLLAGGLYMVHLVIQKEVLDKWHGVAWAAVFLLLVGLYFWVNRGEAVRVFRYRRATKPLSLVFGLLVGITALLLVAG